MLQYYKEIISVQLTERYEINRYLNSGNSQTFIADALGVNKSTISWELRRNVPKRGKEANVYDALKAQIKTSNRHITKPKNSKFTIALKK